MPSGKLSDYLGTGLFENRPTVLDLTAGAVGIYFATDQPTFIYVWDGATWVTFESHKETESPTNISFYLPELKGTDSEFVRIVLAKAGTLIPAAVKGSAKVFADKVLEVRCNGVQVGTITLTAAGGVTYATTSEDWAANDVLTVTGTDDESLLGLTILLSFAH